MNENYDNYKYIQFGTRYEWEFKKFISIHNLELYKIVKLGCTKLIS